MKHMNRLTFGSTAVRWMATMMCAFVLAACGGGGGNRLGQGVGSSSGG